MKSTEILNEIRHQIMNSKEPNVIAQLVLEFSQLCHERKSIVTETDLDHLRDDTRINASPASPTAEVLSSYESWKFLKDTTTLTSYLEAASITKNEELWSIALTSVENVLSAIYSGELRFTRQ